MLARAKEADTPSVSVVICAYTMERWDALVAAIDSVQRQTLPPQEVILVVDHNDSLVSRARAAFARVLVVANLGSPGLSGARNYGVGVAQGTVVAFLDDDAEAADDWLAWLVRGYRAPHVLGVGGAIEPVWLAGRPRWFPAELYWVVGCTYRGMPETTAPVRNMIGANMSCRRDLFEELGGFRDELARVGDRPFGCEESEWCIRASQHRRGGIFLHEPRARVRHRVPPKRARFAYIRSQCYAEGIGKAMISRLVGASDGLASERAYTLQTLPRSVAHGVADALFRGDIAGLGRAGVIIAGTGFAAAGYVRSIFTSWRTTSRAVQRPNGHPHYGASSPSAAEESEFTESSPSSCSGRDPMKVLLVTARYYPFAGGTETHVYEVSKRLARMGALVTVLTTDPTGTLPPVEEENGVHIRRVRAWPKNRDYYFAPKIHDIITREPWDVVHCQSVHTLVAPLTMFAAWRAKIPFVVTSHTGGDSSRFRNGIRTLQWLVLRPLIARASAFITVSKFEAEYFRKLLRLPESKITVIRNGAFLPPSGPIQSRAHDGPLIVSVGRLERYKGHHRAINALSKVLEQEPRARLQIIGAGPFESSLRQMATDRGVADRVEIRSIPADQREEMASIVSQADLFTLLSDYEAHPIAVMEALSLGRSALVTDTSGLRELADQGLVRAISLKSSSAQIADAMVNQLRDPLVPHRVDLPTWDDCAEALFSMYQSVRGESRCIS